MTRTKTTPRTTAAFIGLGAIGAPIATHIAGHTTLAVWNRTRGVAAEFASETGARDADSPASAASSLKPGTMVIDCTSGDPATSRKIADRLARSGIAFIDAPVSGGVSGAV